jgi:hypothetical protein
MKGERKYGDGAYLEFQSAVHHDIASDLPLVPFAVFSSVVPTIKQNSTECTFLAPACEENDVIRDGREIGEERQDHGTAKRAFHLDLPSACDYDADQ